MKPIQKRAERSRAKIIEASLDLFHRQGIHATSVDQILEKSGTGKSQFYHYFKDKKAVIRAVIQNIHAMDRGKMLPFQYDVRSWKDLRQWFYKFIEFQKSVQCARGCPMATISYELTPDDELIRQDIRLSLEYRKRSVVKFFAALKARGKLKKSADPEVLGDFCYSVVQGGMILAKMEKSIAPFENAVKHGLAHLKSLEIK